MSNPTPVDGSTPPSDSSIQPSSEATETVESLKEKLAATEAEKLQAQEEANTWKGRVKGENPPKVRKIDPDEEYLDWKIDNKDRISLVGKDVYEKELSELLESGAKPTLSIREKALKLAEKEVGVKTEHHEPLPSASVDRGGQRDPKMTEYDTAFGVKPETKKKYAHLEEQW